MKGKAGYIKRRKSSLQLLEAQLIKGTKPEKVNNKTTVKMIPLTEMDIKRIKKDIEKLKTK